MMLLLKLTLAPLLVAAATLVAQKWGPRVGGLLMGLPLTTGPIFLLLEIDQGPHFAAGAAVGILSLVLRCNQIIPPLMFVPGLVPGIHGKR